MNRILRSPGQYIQGQGVSRDFAQFASVLGKRILFVTTASGQKRIEPLVVPGLQAMGLWHCFAHLEGECSESEVTRLAGLARVNTCDMIAGVGGGRVLDAAKAAAHYAELPLIIMPTSAATDAPCSALSVLYSPDGTFDRYLFLKQNPQLVLVDSDLIAAAPLRLFVAGMGDALSTYFEARALGLTDKNTHAGGRPTLAAACIAKQCYRTLLENGVAAKQAIEEKRLTNEVENIIEANIYLSGVGFESGGLSAAHAIQKGFTVLPQLQNAYHGEKVAFGTLVQLVLENAAQSEIDEVMKFCKAVGLPLTFKQLGMPEISAEQCMEIALFTCQPEMTIHNLPFTVTALDVAQALQKADAMGSTYLGDYL